VRKEIAKWCRVAAQAKEALSACATSILIAHFAAAASPVAAETVSKRYPVISQTVEKLEGLFPFLQGDQLPIGFAKSNGRIEAQEIQISAKYPGRLAEVAVEEGEIIDAGAIIARIDDREYRAQLLGAEAEVLRAEAALSLAEAQHDQALSALEVARASFSRIERLHGSGHATSQQYDDSKGQFRSAEAAERAGKAQIAAADSAIATASASVSQLKAILSEMVLTAPRRGRVQYQLVQAGEMVAAGSRVATLLDLSDVSMNLYLKAPDVARLAVGDEARIILDPMPEYIIPARITFISGEAQFTPKMVETPEERDQLTFRVKLQLPRDLLERFEDYVKVGVRGVGVVRTDPNVDWPSELAAKVPE